MIFITLIRIYSYVPHKYLTEALFVLIYFSFTSIGSSLKAYIPSTFIQNERELSDFISIAWYFKNTTEYIGRQVTSLPAIFTTHELSAALYRQEQYIVEYFIKLGLKRTYSNRCPDYSLTIRNEYRPFVVKSSKTQKQPINK